MAFWCVRAILHLLCSQNICGERRWWVGRCFLLPCTLTPAGASKLPRLPPSSLASLAIHHLSPRSGYVGGQSDQGGQRPWWRKVDWDGEKNEGKVVPCWAWHQSPLSWEWGSQRLGLAWSPDTSSSCLSLLQPFLGGWGCVARQAPS